MNIHFQLGISSKCDIKAIQKTVLPCVNFIRGKRGYGRWDLMLTYILGVVALLEACDVANSGRRLGCHLVYQELEIRFKPREMVILCVLHEK